MNGVHIKTGNLDSQRETPNIQREVQATEWPREAAARRWPSASKGERPRGKPNLPTPGPETSSLQSVRKCISVVQAAQSVVFYYGRSSRRTQCNMYENKLRIPSLSFSRRVPRGVLPNLSVTSSVKCEHHIYVCLCVAGGGWSSEVKEGAWELDCPAFESRLCTFLTGSLGNVPFLLISWCFYED